MALDLRKKNGFRVISFQNIDILDSFFVHRSSSIKDKKSLIIVRVMALDLCKKNGFRFISFEYIALLD